MHLVGAVRTEELNAHPAPGRHVLRRPPRGRGVARLRAECRSTGSGCAGSSRGARYAHALDGGRAIALYRDVEATAASLDAIRPGDGVAWRAFVTPLLDAHHQVRATTFSGIPPVAGPVRAPGAALGLLRVRAARPGSAEELGRRRSTRKSARRPYAPRSTATRRHRRRQRDRVGLPLPARPRARLASPEGGAGRLTTRSPRTSDARRSSRARSSAGHRRQQPLRALTSRAMATSPPPSRPPTCCRTRSCAGGRRAPARVSIAALAVTATCRPR